MPHEQSTHRSRTRFWKLETVTLTARSTAHAQLPLVKKTIMSQLFKPVGPILPTIASIHYIPSQHPPLATLASTPIPPAKKKALWSRRRLLNSIFSSKKDSPLLTLPSELHLLIASKLPDASRASLALTCIALSATILSLAPFRGLQFPSEQPPEFQSARMSKAQIYQPARWEFLRFLERDLKGKWYLCSECFTLHPRQMFAAYEKSVVPWLKDYYKRKGSDFRSCRYGRKNLCRHRNVSYAPSGIIDLCPCIKMTIGKKRQIEARLREDALKNQSSAVDFKWHRCQHIYGDVELKIRIGIFLYDGTERTRTMNRCANDKTNILSMPPRIGELGVVLECLHTFPSKSLGASPRLLCPHQNLDTASQALLRCRKRHVVPGSVCELCQSIQCCEYCRTKIFYFDINENVSAGITNCYYRVERCLDNNVWPMHTVFPFARRQVPLQRRSPQLPRGKKIQYSASSANPSNGVDICLSATMTSSCM